jgi:peptidoglycan/xylan/chitin deacetylase (PgdA/CDA1 family)
MDRLLDVFSEFSVAATFFIITNKNITGARSADMVRRIVARGHEIGNHGNEDYSNGMWQMSRDEVRAELVTWETRIRNITPWPAKVQDTKWFSPPRGLMSLTMASVLDEMRYETVIGDVYTNDLFTAQEDVDFHARLVEGSTCDGSVLLFHMPNPFFTMNLDIFKRALATLQGRKFRFLRLTDMFSKEGGGFWGACGIGLIVRIMFFLAICVPCAMCIVCCGQALRRCCTSILQKKARRGKSYAECNSTNLQTNAKDGQPAALESEASSGAWTTVVMLSPKQPEATSVSPPDATRVSEVPSLVDPTEFDEAMPSPAKATKFPEIRPGDLMAASAKAADHAVSSGGMLPLDLVVDIEAADQDDVPQANLPVEVPMDSDRAAASPFSCCSA